MKKIRIILLMVATLVTVAQAAPIDSFVNADFDSGATTVPGMFKGFDAPAATEIDGWTNDTDPAGGALNDAGVEGPSSWWIEDDYTDENAAFMSSGDGAYNMSSYTIQDGDVFIIGFTAKTWTANGDAEWTATLFYDTPANVIGTYVQSVTDTWTAYSSNTAIVATPASVGGTLGILFENTGEIFASLDEVAVDRIPMWYVSPADGEDLVATNTDLVITVYDPDIAEIDVQLSTEDDPNLTTKPQYKIVDGMEITTTGNVTIDVPSDLDYGTSYYWKVIGYEPNYLEDPVINNIPVPGPVWSFETRTAGPIIEKFNNITATGSMLPVTLVAQVSDGNGDLASIDFTLLTDDVDFPAGATFTEVSRDVYDLYNPSITVTTDGATDGYFKVKLTATDATGQTAEQIGEVALFTNDPNGPCDARQWMWTWTDGDFNPMDFDEDCDVDLADFAVFAAQWLDDINLKSPEEYENLFVPYGPVVNGTVNGNFELGDFTGWWTSDTVDVAITDVSPLEGAYSAEWTSSTTTGYQWGTGIAQYFPVQANTTYTVTLQIAGGDGYSGTETNELGIRKRGGGTNFITRPNWTPNPTGQQLTLQFTTGAEDEGVEYEIIVFGITADTYYKVDDLQISPSPY